MEDARKGAIGLFREIDYPLWTAMTLYEHATWLREQGRAADAEPFLADARLIFEGLDAKPWVERVEALRLAPRPRPPAPGDQLVLISDRMLPAGSLNQAIAGPSSRMIPRSSCPVISG